MTVIMYVEKAEIPCQSCDFANHGRVMGRALIPPVASFPFLARQKRLDFRPLTISSESNKRTLVDEELTPCEIKAMLILQKSCLTRVEMSIGR